MSESRPSAHQCPRSEPPNSVPGSVDDQIDDYRVSIKAACYHFRCCIQNGLLVAI